MHSKTPGTKKHLVEGKLNEILANLTPAFTARDQYISQIKELVKKRLQIDRKWEEQSDEGLSDLSVELRKLYPDILNDLVVEHASLAFARAFFTCRRKCYLDRVRRQARKTRGVGPSADSTANSESFVKAGPSTATMLRQRQFQSSAGLSIVAAQPRSSNFIEKDNLPVLKPTPNLDQARTRTPPAASPHTSLIEPQTTPEPCRSETYSHHNAPTSNGNTPTTLPTDIADPETNPHIGIEEVKSFLENCSPSMAHHFDSFIRAGVKDGEYLKAMGRLCASNTKVLTSVLGPNLSVIDSILLQENLLRWSKEGTQDEERNAQN